MKREKSLYCLLREKILNKKVTVGVIGLGYVGLPISIEFAKKGFNTIGFDIDKHKIKKLMRDRRSYIMDVCSQDIAYLVNKNVFRATTDFALLRKVDVCIICVPTPWSKTKQPDISKIIEATHTLLKYIHTPLLVILESTTYPGTTEEILVQSFLKRKLIVGEEIFVCFSPERIDPGNKEFKFSNIPKVISGKSKKCLNLGKLLYSQVVEKVYTVSSLATAEMVKLLENSFRFINIGFINEFAMLCKKMNIDVWEVIRASSTKPFGYMPFYPGPGIGGECIPADPLYLAWKAKISGFEPRMIDLASQINFYMPTYIIDRIFEVLNNFKKSIKGSKILICGITYKKDVSDTRESPALEIMEKLFYLGAKISYIDPYVKSIKIKDKILISKGVNTNFSKYDLVVICTEHSIFDYEKIRKEAPLIFDARGVYKNSYENIVKL